MEHGFKLFTVIDRFVGRVATPRSRLVSCLAEAYPKHRFLPLPDWAAALLFRMG